MSHLFQSLLRTFQRFPLAILSSAAGTVLTIISIESREPRWENVILALSLAVPTFIAIVLKVEAKELSQKTRWLFQGLMIVLLTLYAALLPPHVDSMSAGLFIRHMLWGVALTLLVSFIPFLFQKRETAIHRFWEFNKRLFFTGTLTLIWSGVLQLGLTVAVFAVSFLFEVNSLQERIPDIHVFIWGIFAAIFFLHRIPERPHELSIDSYPKEVHLFTQYLLVPLVTLYFLILYAYVIRILVTGDWPAGELAWMIIGFSFVGVLTYLALYPLRATHMWVRYFGAGLFMAMVPQTGILFWALSFRLRDYGITENRYFVLAFGAWLLVCAIYFLLSRAKDIRLIPISLCVLAILASFGPWSAFAVSERSQVNRLEKILTRNELLQDGQYIPRTRNLAPEDEEEILEILRYLSDFHSLDAIEPWFNGEDLDSDEPWNDSDRVLREKFELNVDGISRVNLELFHARLGMDEHVMNSDGYDWVVEWSRIESMGGFDLNETHQLVLQEEAPILELRRSGNVLATIDLSSIVKLARQKDELNLEEATINLENEQVRLRLLIRSMQGEIEDDIITINQLNGFLLLTIK